MVMDSPAPDASLVSTDADASSAVAFEGQDQEDAAKEGDHLTRIAVFDYDGTVISGQSGALFSRYLLMRGYLNPIRALRLGWWGFRYVFHLPYDETEARTQIFGALREHTTDEVHQLMLDFHDQVLLKRYRPEAVAEVQKRRDEGCVTLLISATFYDIALAASKVLGVDGLVATDMERDETGHYTGNVAGNVIAGQNKIQAVTQWADEHIGPGKWVIAYSYADHHTDEDLLSVSEKAYAVTPGKSLKHKAKRMNWEVVDWD